MIMLNKVVCRAFSVVMLCVLGFILMLSLISTTYISDNETVYYVSDRPYTHFVTMLILIAILYVGRKKVKLTQKTVMIVGIVIFSLLAMYLFSSMFRPRFDQRCVMNIAAQMVCGDYTEFQTGGYADLNPHQNGLLLYYEALGFVFGYNNLVVIQFINLIFSVGAIYAIYLLYQMLTERYLYMTLAVMLFLPFWGYISLIYGNVPAFSFGVWGLYFVLKYLKDKKWSKIFAASMCMMLSCILKMNFKILLIAIVILVVLEAIKKKSFGLLIMPIVMTVFVLAGDKGVNLIIQEQTGKPVADGTPAVSFVAMGLHEHIYRGAGWFDDYPIELYEQYSGNMDEIKTAATEDIKASIEDFKQHPKYMLGFFIRKVASMWNEPSYDSLSIQMNRESLLDSPPRWVNILVSKGAINSFIYQIMNIIESLLMMGAFVYYIFHFKEEDFVKNVFALFFIGGFMFHLFWEASSQYAIFYVMLLAGYAVEGFADLVKWGITARRRDVLLALSVAVMVVVVLSMPGFVDFLTLNRSEELYMEYLQG